MQLFPTVLMPRNGNVVSDGLSRVRALEKLPSVWQNEAGSGIRRRGGGEDGDPANVNMRSIRVTGSTSIINALR